MCGIAGCRGMVAEGERLLVAMTDAVALRGPDDEGRRARGVGLAQRRLAAAIDRDALRGGLPLADPSRDQVYPHVFMLVSFQTGSRTWTPSR